MSERMAVATATATRYRSAIARGEGGDPRPDVRGASNGASRVVCTLGIVCAGRLAGHLVGIVAGLGFGGTDPTGAVHEALLVVPADVVGVEELDAAQRPASEG